MKGAWKYVGWGLIIMAPALLLAVFASLRGPSQPSATPSATATPSPTQSPSATDEASSHPEEPPGPCDLSGDLLRSRTDTFVDIWYLLGPTDTTEIKQDRLAGLATPGFLQSEVRVSTSTMADKARVRDRIVLYGSTTPEDVEVYCLDDVGTGPEQEAVTIAKVQTWHTLPSGQVASGSTIDGSFGLHWTYTKDGTWLVDRVNENGDAP